MLIAQLCFKEHLSAKVWLGTTLISLGVILISSKNNKTDPEAVDGKLSDLKESEEVKEQGSLVSSQSSVSDTEMTNKK
jgi:drug/metabolite transporter (DMT)-like permease